MFPLSAEFINTLQLSLFFAFCSLCFLSIAKSKLFALLPLGIYAAYSVWALMNGGGGNDGLGRQILVVFLLILLIAGGLWALALQFGFRRINSRRQIKVWKSSAQILAVAPAIIISLFAITKQYVPSSMCTSDGIEIIVGGEEYTLRREYNSMIRIRPAAPKRRTQFHYSYEPEHKKDLVSICGFSDGGQTPISVGQVWIEPKGLQPRQHAFCGNRSGMSERMCTEYSSFEWDTIASLRLIERSEFTGYMYGLSHREVHNIAELKKDPAVLAEGDVFAGYMCRKSIHPSAEGNYCSAWREAGNETIFIGRTKTVVGTELEELLKSLDVAMDFAILQLSR